MLIGQGLLNKGFVTEDQLDEALDIQKNQGGLLGIICISQKFITERQLLEILIANQLENKIINYH